MIAGDVMDAAASLMNDSAKATYTYSVQLPFLRMALKELREIYELNNIPITNKTSAVLTVPAGITEVGFLTSPALPSDLIEIQQLHERPTGSGSFIPMGKREFLPHFLDNPISTFRIWAWVNNAIQLLESSQSNDLKLDYVQKLFTNIVDQNSTISVESSFLDYRTAALCAEFIGENPERAEKLNGMAVEGIDRSLGISNKSKQAIITRRRPFRSGYKGRG